MSSNVPKLPRQFKMVAWYHPLQLAKTAVDVLISLIFGRHADYRLIEALGAPNTHIHDYTFLEKNHEDCWIDYTADLGDGFNSTYAIAYHLSQPTLILQDSTRAKHLTQRGAILIFGGDTVYPVASRAEYQNRLINVYETALCETKTPHPDLYVTPGNHDWYDSLAAYTRLFCAKRWFAGWRTQQERSYFALKLPYHWWLIGTDIQLASDIDDKQIQFFREVAEKMEAQDKIILCTAEPEWIFAKMYSDLDPEYSENNLAYLENKIFKDKIAIFIAGDLHHYRRHENPQGQQKIIAGGGGAFLHPTHGQDVSLLSNQFALKKEFPDSKTSRKLCWRNFGFLFLNPTFGFVTGFLYLLTAWTVKVDLSHFSLHEWFQALSTAFNQALKTPIGPFWIVGVMLGFIVFTDTHSWLYRIIGGGLHGLTHVFAIFFIGWAVMILSSYYHLTYDSTSQLLFLGALTFLGGWIVGSFIMGAYLFISLNLFGRHSNEAFSSLAIQDWKNFLRLKITPTGELTIYPIGVARVPRKWKLSLENKLIPDDAKASEPELIETPIKVMR